MQIKQILLTALIANNVLNSWTYAKANELDDFKKTNEIISNGNPDAIATILGTKAIRLEKDLEKLATKADLNQLIKPIKRTRWFVWGALTGGLITCVSRKHEAEIQAALNRALPDFTDVFADLVATLKTMVKDEKEAKK